ncbi:MAG: glycosyltransferase family 4 protein [bacterium]
MRPLRVVQVISSPWWTGAAEPALHLTADLADRGHLLHFVCGEGERLEEEAREAGFPRPEGVEPTRSLNPLKLRRTVEDLAKLFEEVSAEIVHAHLSADHWLSVFAARRLKRRIHIVRSVHHPRAVKGDILHRRLLWKETDAVVASSQHIGELLLNRAQVPSRQVSVVPGGVDLRRFRPASIEVRARGRELLGTPPDTLLIGIVSRLAPDRGHKPLFEAFREVSARLPKARLVVVGKGEHLPRLKERVAALGLEERVDFPGYREDDLVEILGAFDIFTLMAPGSEGTCRAALEAMAMGLPCVVVDEGGLGEVVEHRVTGIVLPSRMPALVTEVLLDLLLDKQRRVAFGKAARARAEKHYPRELRAERVEAVYAGMLEFSQAVRMAQAGGRRW